MRNVLKQTISIGSGSKPRGSHARACSRLVIGVSLVLGLSVEKHAAAQGEPASEAPSAALEEAKKLEEKAEEYYVKGQYDAALSLIEEVLQIRENAFGLEHPDVAMALNDLAGMHMEKANYERALPLFERSLVIREKTLGQDHPDVAVSLNNLAMLQYSKGDYERALPLFKRSLAISEKNLGEHHPIIATTLNNLGALHMQKGDYERAVPIFERSLAIREKTLGEHHPQVARSLNNLGVLYEKKGDYEHALALHERSMVIKEKTLGERHPDVAMGLNNIATIYQTKGDYERAVHHFQRSLAINEEALGEHHPEVARALSNLATLHEEKGDYERALPLLERSLVIKQKALGKHHREVSSTLSNLALLQWARGSNGQAMSYLQRAMDAREAHITLASAGDSARARRLLLTQYSDDLDQAISFALQHEKSGARRLALATLLSRKGRVLDATSDAFATVRRRLGPDEQKLLDEYRANRTIYARQLLRGPGRVPEAQHRKNLAALEQRANELERLIAARSNEFRGQLRSVTPEAVQAALPEGAMLVEWVRYRAFDPRAERKKAYGAERYAASILGKTGAPVWLDLGEARPIDAAVAAWRSALARQLATSNQLGRELDALVMAPVRARLGNATNVFLAPDGPLHLVPFAALVDVQGRHLVQRYSFIYLTSGRDLLRLHDQKNTAASSPPLIMADPQYHVPSQPDFHDFAPLPQVMAEARDVQSFFPDAILLSGAQATEAALKRARGPAIVHIATHGYFTPMTCGASDAEASDASLQSGLALAGANACQSPATQDAKADSDDGLLTALEAASLDLHGTELAVLSACDTGIGATELRDEFMDRNIGRGEGVYGLRRALVLAGARTQMVSLWRVDDAVTRQLMTMYYRKLASGAGRAEALRQVQLELLASKDLSLPYYWASFIVSGDPSPLPQKVTSSIPPVQRGARGCACDAAPAQGLSAWPGSVLLAFFALGLFRLMRRLRSPRFQSQDRRCCAPSLPERPNRRDRVTSARAPRPISGSPDSVSVA
jgi:CHAT domain-containing protein/Tfp pilus assembly protein PilF